jgi:sulfur carrier protein ThiS
MENTTFIINRENRTVSPVANVRELLGVLGISEDGVAAELNRKIIGISR